MKSHNILIEPWRETSSFTYERGEPQFRWTVTYEAGDTAGDATNDGGQDARQVAAVRLRFGRGTARTHAEAREAAEAFLAERGIELKWQPPASSTTRILTPRSGRPRFLHL